MKPNWKQMRADLIDLPLNILAFLAELIESTFMSRGFRLFLALTFFISENEYFGWNRRPQSEAELLADGLFLLLLMVALLPKSETKVIINQRGVE